MGPLVIVLGRPHAGTAAHATAYHLRRTKRGAMATEAPTQQRPGRTRHRTRPDRRVHRDPALGVRGPRRTRDLRTKRTPHTRRPPARSKQSQARSVSTARTVPPRHHHRRHAVWLCSRVDSGFPMGRRKVRRTRGDHPETVIKRVRSAGGTLVVEDDEQVLTAWRHVAKVAQL